MVERATRSGGRRRIAVVLVATSVSLAFVLHQLDLAALERSLEAYAWQRVPLAMLLYGATLLARTARLRCLVSTSLSYGRTVLIVGAGHLASTVVPLHLGVLASPYLLATTADVPFGKGLAAAVVERVLDLAMLTTLVLGATAFAFLPERADESALAAPVVFAISAGLAVAALAALATLGPRLLAGTRTGLGARFPALATTVAPMLEDLVVALQELARRPRTAARAALWTVSWWCTSMGTAAVTMGGLAELPPVTPRTVVLNQIGVVAGTAAVPSPGHVGGFEAGVMGAMMLSGASADAARAFALILHATQLGFTVLVGLACFVIAGWRVRDVVSAQRPGRDALL